MGIDLLKNKLHQRRRMEVKKINDKYRKLIKDAEAKCPCHEFGEWQMRWDGLTNFYQTNFRGQPFEFRECRLCGKAESRIKD